MKNIDINLKLHIDYDSIVFDGENYEDVISFVKKYHINGEPDHFWEIRPKNIPNLDEVELRKWWESTGEIKEAKWGDKYNTHNSNNLPLWRKDELLRIVTKGSMTGYVHNYFIKKGCTILVFGKNGKNFEFYEKPINVEDEVIDMVLSNIPHRFDIINN